jgi:hypothetical protein
MKDFTLHPEALELKELGFDEPCFGWYDAERPMDINYDRTNNSCGWLNGLHCAAPTYSQAFRFFREKHNISHSIEKDWVTDGVLLGYEYTIEEADGITVSKTFNTYEDAELECLKKIIKIVKNK